MSDEVECIGNGGHAEEKPGEVDNVERDEDPHQPDGHLDVAKLVDAEHLFHHQRHTMRHAPEHESPVGTVPKTAHGECQQQVEVIARLAATASSQRDVDVVFQPA